MQEKRRGSSCHIGGETVSEVLLDEALKAVAIGAHDAGVHHADAPEQQRDAAKEVEDEFGAGVHASREIRL